MKYSATSISCTLSLLLAGCAETPPPAATTSDENFLGAESVATVNSRPLAKSLLDQLSLLAAQRPSDSLTDEQRSQLIEQLVTMTVLADSAEQDGLDEDQTLAAELELQRRQILARAATEKFRGSNAPTEAELRTAYEDNLPRYLATQYKARHILVESEEEAESIMTELEAGGDFAELAMEHSTGPTGPRGGDLGWFTADSMVEPFADAVRAAEIGTHAPEPVQTQFGWHVILVEDQREQQPPGLEAVRDELVSIVERSKLQAFVEELREQADN